MNKTLKFWGKLKKKIRWGGGGGEGGQGGCERRIEVFVKIQKKKFAGEGQDECERRIEVFVKIQKKKNGWGWVGRGLVGGVSGWMLTKN